MKAQPSEPAAPPHDGSSQGAHEAPHAELIRPRGGGSRAGRISRRSAAISGSLLGAAWLVLIFGSALADVNAAHRRAEQTRADSAALQARLDQGRAEVGLIQTDAFLRLQARAYGMGERGERAFALEAGTPLIDPVLPLGTAPEPPAADSPLDDWLQLLFG